MQIKSLSFKNILSFEKLGFYFPIFLYIYTLLNKIKEMKKSILPILTMAAIVLGLSSCVKNYTCTCTFDEFGERQRIEYTIDNAAKTDAITRCDNKALELEGKSNISCQLGEHK